MRILQMLPTLSMGDAVGNDAMALSKVLRDMGAQTGIYAENIDRRLPAGIAKPVSRMPKLTKDDVILYHMSTGSDLNFELGNYPCRKGLIYHNITPSGFFRPYNSELTRLMEYGAEGVCHLADKVDFCMADSEFNKQELQKVGYTCDITVRPILIPFSDYARKPEQSVIKKYENDGYVNFIFVGRIAPNKKQEDIIRAFYCYKKYINPKSRLILVGSYKGLESYYRRLCRYVTGLELDDVIFTGHIPFSEILAYYHIADLFLCMSEHEGFCVPLVEAMYFSVPILAYNSCAVPDTLGGSGVLLNSKDPMETAMIADRILRDSKLRREIIAEQRKRQQDFSYQKVRTIFEQQLMDFLKHEML